MNANETAATIANATAIDLASPALRLTGKGEVDILRQAIDLTAGSEKQLSKKKISEVPLAFRRAAIKPLKIEKSKENIADVIQHEPKARLVIEAGCDAPAIK